ncbi:HEAT repeat domain-containing protein [Streptomyces virginiae]|uniref:HEAT repeat domain-containing protein n=1 Tax=Streptomyces TaxID=1883 RepID=UPI0013692451|nr:HEAT repeat domain-containing protein [Streptomyces sp. SID1046]MYV73158.1 ankyrin repeat domain-containing protein [Streptomyces sp. SID1046]
MTELDARLVDAVAPGEAETVRALLAEGADPDAVGEDGLPVLCAAIAAYAVESVEMLVAAGADPDRPLPDGTTPLLRAVDAGSSAVWAAVRGPAPLRDGERPLAAARRWYEVGAEAELRRLTGAHGPARSEIVRDGESGRIREITLGGRTVRDGHGAILTFLEEDLRILPPVGELVTRAVRQADAYGAWDEDEEHVDRAAARGNLLSRQSAETWRAVVEFHRHPAPAHRAFAADFLNLATLTVDVFPHDVPHHRRYGERLAELLPGWAAVEPDPGVLAMLLRLLTDRCLPQARALGLRYADHPDPRVRRRVPWMLHPPGAPATARVVRGLARDPDGEVRQRAAEVLDCDAAEDREVLIALLRDENPQVRERAAYAVRSGRDRSPAVTEALLELLDADGQDERLSAAFALACRDHPRTPEAYEKVGPLRPEYERDPRADGLWRWRFRNDPAGRRG